MKLTTFHPLALVSGAVLSVFAWTANAAPIGSTTTTWGTPTAISGVGDVLTTGALVGAFNLGTQQPALVGTTTVNGVPFAAFAVPNGGSGTTTVQNFSLNFSANRYSTDTALGSAAAPFATLDSAYKSLLQSGVASFNGTITLTITGLTAGQQYAFQWWSNDSGPNFAPYATTSTAVNTVAVNDNPTGLPGGTGQYVIGTFTADNPNQVVIFSGASATPLLNAFQLRLVPEPSSVTLMLGAGCLLALRRRRA